MSRPSKLSVPTNAALPHTHRLSPSSPEASRTLSRLSRPSLIALALQWLSSEYFALCAPFLLQEDDDDEGEGDEEAPYDPARSVEELQEIWLELQNRKGGKREIVERILEGDWRRGVTLYQLAMVETRYLQDHPTSLRWTALRIEPLRTNKQTNPGAQASVSLPEYQLPRVHAQTFVLNLQGELAALAKAHYYLTRIESRSASLLRISIMDSPYSSQKSLHDKNAKLLSSNESARTIFLIFPDGSPHVFISLGTNTGQTADLDARSTNSIVLDAVSKALSKVRERFTLKPTALSVKSLDTLFSLRGAERGNSAQGGWSIFISNTFSIPPIDYRLPPSADPTDPPQSQPSTHPNPLKRTHDGETSSQALTHLSPSSRKRRQIAAGRFGTSALPSDGRALERLDIRLDDPFPYPAPMHLGSRLHRPAHPLQPSTTDAGSRNIPAPSHKDGKRRGRRARSSLLDVDQENLVGGDEGAAEEQVWRPDVRVRFLGQHVFAGVRRLVEGGFVDGKRMAGWMTGEAGVSVGVVRDGRIIVKDSNA